MNQNVQTHFKSCPVNIARFLKCVLAIWNIMNTKNNLKTKSKGTGTKKCEEICDAFI